MGLLSKKSIRTLGLLFTALFFMLAIVAVVLAGMDYQYAGPDWKEEGPWHAVPGLQLAAAIYAIVIGLIGFVTFTKPNISYTIFFSLILMLSILLNLAVGIFVIIASHHGWANSYLGCKGEYDGVIGYWNGIDAYLQQVDQGLCSDDCPCEINNADLFTKNQTVANFYDSWVKTPSDQGNVRFQSCPASVQTNAYNRAIADDANFDPDRTFNAQKFTDFMANVERDFECSGWCNVAYRNTRTNEDTIMYKYLFTDVNRGPVKHLGCLNEIIKWLPNYLKAYAGMILGCFGAQMLVFILSICQCYAREKDHEHQIPHHHDDNRQ